MQKNKINFCYYSKSKVKGSAMQQSHSIRSKKVQISFNFFSLTKTAGRSKSRGKKDLHIKQPIRFFDVNKKINRVQLCGQNFKKIRNMGIGQRNSKPNINNKVSTKLMFGTNFFIGEIRRKISSSKRPFLQTPKNSKVSIHKEYKLYYKQKVWYRDKAALLPGANIKFTSAFVQKNKFYKKIYIAYKVFKKMYSFPKKSLLKLYKNSYACGEATAISGAMANSMEFSMLMLIDSLNSSSMYKSGLVLNKREKDIFKNYYSNNGKSVHKKKFYQAKSIRAINKDGDFCIGANVHGYKYK